MNKFIAFIILKVEQRVFFNETLVSLCAEYPRRLVTTIEISCTSLFLVFSYYIIIMNLST